MPADWPLDTPVPAMLERVRARALQRRHHRRARNAVAAGCLVMVGVLLTAALDFSSDASRVRTTPAGEPKADGNQDRPTADSKSGGTTASSAAGPGSRGGAVPPGAAPTITRPAVVATTTTTTPPRPAPDAEIAFERSGEIWLMRADGSGAGRLTDSSHRMADPDWSPDGRHLVAAEWSSDVTGKGVSRLARVDPDGSVHTLTSDGHYQEPRWSPDGSRIAFNLYVSSPTSSHFEVWTMRADGSDARRVDSAGDSPSWSPDGRRLVYGCAEGLCTANHDGSGRQVVPNTTDVGSPVWSPDGQRLAVKARDPDGRPLLAIVRPDGTDRRSVVTGPLFSFDWSVDGRYLVFDELDEAEQVDTPQTCPVAQCDQGEGMRIWRVEVDGSDRRMLTAGPGDFTPSWRPTQPR